MRRLPDFESWSSAQLPGNPAVLAAEQAMHVAEREVAKQRAGHEPTVDLVMSKSNNIQGVGNFPGQNGYDIRQRFTGVQINVPIFQGGTQSAKVAEALAALSKAQADLEGARRSARFVARQAWLTRTAAVSKESSALAALDAARSALNLAERGVAAGIRTEFDVLQARQLLVSARRDLRKARYDEMLSHTKLRSLSGQWTPEDFVAIQATFLLDPLAP